MSDLSAVLEQRENFADSLELREAMLKQYAKSPDDDPLGYGGQLLPIGELQLRCGQNAVAAQTFEKAMASLRKAPRAVGRAGTEAQIAWLQINLLQGLAPTARGPDRRYVPRPSPQHRGRCGIIGGRVRNSTKLDWSKLHFKIQAWAGSPQVTDTATVSAGGGSATTEGSLADLWAMPEPKPGLYLFSMSVPRRNSAPIRQAHWMFVAPWKVSFFAANTEQVADTQKWKARQRERPCRAANSIESVVRAPGRVVSRIWPCPHAQRLCDRRNDRSIIAAGELPRDR